MAEDTTGSGTRAEREDSTIQRVPYSSLEEQQEMDRRREENATLGRLRQNEQALKEQKETDALKMKAEHKKISGEHKEHTQDHKSGPKPHRHHAIPPY